MSPEVVFWLTAVIVLLVIEGATMSLVGIWFAAGAAVALISAMLGSQIWLQCIWFVLISAITLAATRPFVKKYINSKKISTNADSLIGTQALVKEVIDNINGHGAVFAGGKIWTARTENEEIIEEGRHVRILRIEGVKLIVEKT